MNKPVERDYTSQVAYTRALEEYCGAVEVELAQVKDSLHGWVKENAPGGWINGIRVELAQCKADAERWSTFISLNYTQRTDLVNNASLAPVLIAWIDKTIEIDNAISVQKGTP